MKRRCLRTTHRGREYSFTPPRPIWWRLLPSLAVCLVLVWHGGLYWLQPAAAVVNRYEVAAREAVLREDYRAASVFYRKLLRLGQSDARTRLRLAICFLCADRQSAALVILDEIALADRTGLSDGHWLQASLLLTTPDRGTADVLRHHLRCATRSQFSEQAHAILATCHLQRGQTRQAAEHARHACKRWPSWAYWLVSHYQESGDTDSARRHLPAAIGYLHRRLQDSPYDVSLRIALARCLQWNHQFESAAAVLVAGLGVGPDRRLNRALAALELEVWSHLPTWEPPSRRLLVLQNGLARTAEFPALRRKCWEAIKLEAGRSSCADLKRVAQSSPDVEPLARYLWARCLLEVGEIEAADVQFRRAHECGFPVREAGCTSGGRQQGVGGSFLVRKRPPNPLLR